MAVRGTDKPKYDLRFQRIDLICFCIICAFQEFQHLDKIWITAVLILDCGKNSDATGLVPARTMATKEKYRSNFLTAERQFKKELGYQPTIEQTICRYVGNHEIWAPAAIRAYTAGIRQKLLDLRLGGSIDHEEHLRLYDILGDGPNRRPAGVGVKRGPARKRKSLRDSEIAALLNALSLSPKPADRLLAFLIINSIRFFPRPAEWADAYSDQETNSLFFVNSKNTNDRSVFEPKRSFDLANVPTKQIQQLVRFLDLLGMATEQVGSWEVMERRQKDRLRYWCKKNWNWREFHFTLFGMWEWQQPACNLLRGPFAVQFG